MTEYYNNNNRVSWPNEPQDAIVQKLAYFTLWPFGTWLWAIWRANTKSSYVIFFLFSLLICWHFEETGYTHVYDDFLGIRDRFIKETHSIIQVFNDISLYLQMSDKAPKELYENILNCIVKDICGGNYHLFFLLAAIPVVICQLNILKYITEDSKFPEGSIIGLIILAMFIFPRDIVTVQNPRFVTGFWVCVLASIYYYCGYGNKLWCLILIVISPFFHSAMLVYVVIFCASIFVPMRWRYLEVFALCSIPFMFFDAGLLSSVNIQLDFLPNAIRVWSERQMSDKFYAKFILNEGRSGFWWISSLFELLLKLAYIYMTYSLIKNKDKFIEIIELKGIYYFYLFVFAIINLIQFVPILGERFFWFSRVFCLFVWFKALYGINNKPLYFLLFACSWGLIRRYGYFMGGALACSTPADIYFAPLPYLLGKGLFW